MEEMQESEKRALEAVGRVHKGIVNLFKRFRGTIVGKFFIQTGKLVLYAVVFFFVFQLLTAFNPFNGTNGHFVSSGIDSSDSEDSTSSCSVFGINLHGRLLTYIPQHAEGDSFFDYDTTSSEDVIGGIQQVNEDPDISAILIEVDSGGGLPVAGEEIANAIKQSEKPVIAVIRQTGASAAYFAISSSDKIFASKNSDVGGIGVTSSYLSNTIKNQQDGYTYEQLTAGKYKDSGNPDKPLTAEEKKLFLRDINIVYENFVAAVSHNRNIPLEKVRVLADGSTMLGESAKENGLIDEIGGMTEAQAYITKTIGEKSDICWY